MNEFGFMATLNVGGETADIQVSCLLHEQGATTVNFMLLLDGATYHTVMEEIGSPELNAFLSMINRQVDILSTANSTVDEWLLANTEGVSV